MLKAVEALKLHFVQLLVFVRYLEHFYDFTMNIFMKKKLFFFIFTFFKLCFYSCLWCVYSRFSRFFFICSFADLHLAIKKRMDQFCWNRVWNMQKVEIQIFFLVKRASYLNYCKRFVQIVFFFFFVLFHLHLLKFWPVFYYFLFFFCLHLGFELHCLTNGLQKQM